jgi:hypothetical protein
MVTTDKQTDPPLEHRTAVQALRRNSSKRSEVTAYSLKLSGKSKFLGVFVHVEGRKRKSIAVAVRHEAYWGGGGIWGGGSIAVTPAKLRRTQQDTSTGCIQQDNLQDTYSRTHLQDVWDRTHLQDT